MKGKFIVPLAVLILLTAIAPLVFAEPPKLSPTLDDNSQAEVAFIAPDIDEGVEPDLDGGANGLSYDFLKRAVSFKNESYSAEAPAYMKVTSTLPWTVSVSITPFAQTAHPSLKTIEGFTIDLDPSGITNYYPEATGIASVAQQTISAIDIEGNPIPPGTHGAESKAIAQGTMGVWNVQIPAVLNVLGDNAHVGGAIAEINWIFAQTKP